MLEKMEKKSLPTEGQLTKAVEKRTAQVPSMTYLGLGMGSALLALGLKAAGRHNAANFVGLWTPTILLMGLYNKLIKLEGSDAQEPA